MANFAAFGPYRGVTGYDNVVRNFILGWWNNMNNVRLMEFKEWSNFRAQTEIDHILNQYEQNNVQPDFLLNFSLLDQTRLEVTIKNVCYTMFEADSICTLWAKSTEPLDLVIVPTEFNKKSFASSGVPENKLAVCPCPLNIDKILQPPVVTKLAEGLNVINNYSKRFLNCSEFVTRKNLENLIRLWCEETKPTDDACLVLKLNSNSGLKLDFFREKVKHLLKDNKCAPIYILTDFLTEAAMYSLYHWCTHYISMSYGEGWGMSESICGVLGKTLIVPNHSAYTAYATPETAYLINSQTIPAICDGPVARYYDGLRWFAPIKFSAKKQLRAALNDNSNDKGLALSTKLKGMCDLNKVSQQLIDTIQNHNYKRSKPVSVPALDGKFNLAMFCKSAGTKCGIADYSTALYTGFNENPTHLANSLLAGNESIYYNTVLDKYDVNIVHVQLEYQFMSPKRLEILAKYCKDANMKLVVTMHTVNPRAWDYHEVLIRNNVNIIVSSPIMRDVLINCCGFSKDNNKITVIPMGIKPDECIKPEKKLEKPTIGFFGFCYFHKGVDKLAYYAKNRPDVDFLVFSTKPDNDSGYFVRCKELVKRLDISNFNWVEDYLPENEIVKKLSETTAIFLPYSEYGGYGVSAAIRTCLKAGTPIMTLKNSFFMDVVHYEGLLHFVGENPDNLQEWMPNANVFLRKAAESEYSANFLNLRDLFVERYSWKSIAKQTQGFYNTLVRE